MKFSAEFEIIYFFTDLRGTYKLEMTTEQKETTHNKTVLRNKVNIPIKITEESHKNSM